MISRNTYKNLIWVDAQSPNQSEVRTLMEEFDLHPLVTEELLVKTLRSKVDVYKNFIYMILHFPTITHTHRGEKDIEIDFIIGKNFLITAHYGLVDTIYEFSKIFEVNTLLKKLNE